MVKLTKIKFQEDERDENLTFEIPKENQIKFEFGFEKVEEEVCCVGGYLIALPKDEMKAFLESRELTKKLRMTQFGFDTAEGEVWFTIPKTYTFKKSEYNSQRAADFAGMVFVKLVSAELRE